MNNSFDSQFRTFIIFYDVVNPFIIESIPTSGGSRRVFRVLSHQASRSAKYEWMKEMNQKLMTLVEFPIGSDMKHEI